MQCPDCKSHLVRSERSGIATEYCPQCRTWLDKDRLQKQTREELEKRGQTRSVTDTRPPLPPDEDNG